MKTLDRKLVRDLVEMRGPVLSISLVVACGIAAFVTLRGTWSSLVQSRDNYYQSERFAQVFAHLERAPWTLLEQVRILPGVALAAGRIVEGMRLPMAELGEPAVGRVVSLPDVGQPPLCDVRLTAGRLPEPGRPSEVLLLEGFAEAHGIAPGAVLEPVLHGRRHRLTVVGLAMSPEYVFAVSEGAMAPSPDRYAVLWMRYTAAAAVFGLSGSFNDVTARLTPGASRDAVVRDLDRLLRPYGGLGSHGRDRQISHLFLNQELVQLEAMARVAPGLFLAIAAFLLNVVLSRLVQLQRAQIATLKAVGYSNARVGRHYLLLALTVVTIGTCLGLGLGTWLGRGMTELYTEFFRMPLLAFRLDPRVGLFAVMASLAAGIAGSSLSVLQVTRLSPAEAMRPAAPPRYRRGLFSALTRLLAGPAANMVWRELTRRPGRLLLSVVGIALGVAMLVLGRSFTDAMSMLTDAYMQTAQREDVVLTFERAVDTGDLPSLYALPGVRRVEWLASMPVRISKGPYTRNSLLMARAPGDELRPLLTRDFEVVSPPERGILLTHTLSRLLRAPPGSLLRVEALEGERQVREVRVVGTLRELFGLQGYMTFEQMHRLWGRAPSATAALLRLDPEQVPEFDRRVAELPAVIGVSRKQTAIDQFRKQSGESVAAFAGILTLFAVIIAVGVVYNNARVTLSSRSRDLASLRVLGFTQGEVAQILIGELAVQVVLALPLGLWLGSVFADSMMSNTDQELYRLPGYVSLQSYAFSALVTLGAAAATALVIHRKLHKLDLIAVLKTRE